MKRNVASIVFSLMLIFLLSAFSGWTSPRPNANQNNEDIQILQVLEISKDNECKDPQAPCIAEVFSTSPIKINSSTQSYTCGIQFKNGLGDVVASLSETITVKFETYNHTIISGYNTPWAVNSAYYWREVNGPWPRSGTYANKWLNYVKTTGTLWYIAGPWRYVTLNITINAPNFSCSARY